MTTDDHRQCCPELYPPDDWQESHPGESWAEWYRRTYERVWMGLLSEHGWPMAGMSYAPCICPDCTELSPDDD